MWAVCRHGMPARQPNRPYLQRREPKGYRNSWVVDCSVGRGRWRRYRHRRTRLPGRARSAPWTSAGANWHEFPRECQLAKTWKKLLIGLVNHAKASCIEAIRH